MHKYPNRIIDSDKNFTFGRKNLDANFYNAKIKNNAALMSDQKISGILKLLYIKFKFLFLKIIKKILFIRKINKIIKNLG